MSTIRSGWARRRFIIGPSDWPPAISLPSPPDWCRWRRNGAGANFVEQGSPPLGDGYLEGIGQEKVCAQIAPGAADCVLAAEDSTTGEAWLKPRLVTIGGARSPSETADAADLMKRAEAALKQARQAGTNRVELGKV